MSVFTRRLQRSKAAYLFLAPGYLFFIAFTLAPLLAGVWLSLFRIRGQLSARTWVGADNYLSILTDGVFRTAVANTVVLMLGTVPVVIVSGMLIAVAMADSSQRLQTFFRTAFYLPRVASEVVIAIIWLWIFNPIYGLGNYVLGLVGLAPIGWHSDPRTALMSIILVVITLLLGETVILYSAGLSGISPEYYDAAAIDGASFWQQLRYVTVPLLTPTTFFIVVTETIWVLQVWAIVYLITSGGPGHATETLGLMVYRTAFELGEFGVAAAQGVTLLILILTITLAYFRVARWDEGPE
jgi:multiple sugar transport system permease protein